jgi:hypothetical protein
MSEIKVNKITPKQNCTQVTLGDSGDTFVIPSGVTITNNGTQTGFGRTGTVDWDTTAKTASFTAVSGNGYFVNTTSGAVTVTLPATPSAGDIVYVKDYTGTFSTNACTVARNGSNIRGAASDFDLEKNNSGGVFIYVDATEGWQIFLDGSDVDASQTFMCATGGTITCCGDYKIHTFTGPGTFTVNSLAESPADNSVEYLVVAGGGGGSDGINVGGAGGAGGFRFAASSLAPLCYPAKPLAGSTITAAIQSYPITVGAGGPGGSSGCAGSNSVFSTITSSGGGQGGTCSSGSPGGSGGGGGSNTDTIFKCGGTGNTPPVSPPQGNNGGRGRHTPGVSEGGGGGGGAITAGTDGDSPPSGGPGGTGGTGAGVPTAFGSNGVPSGGFRYYAGGGGGGGNTAGPGGLGGGGAGSQCTGCGTAGTANTGGGGGSAKGPGPDPKVGGAGGSGIVIIRYKYQ